MLQNTSCPENPTFHHQDVRLNTFCPGCGQKNTQQILSTVQNQATSNAQSNVINLVDDEEEQPVRGKRGLFIPTSQTQVLHSMSHLPPGEEQARRAYARTTVDISRQRSITGRAPSYGNIRGPNAPTRKSFFEVCFQRVQWLVTTENDPFNRHYIHEENSKAHRASIPLTNATIEGADDFIKNKILPEVELRWASYREYQPYIATRIDSKTGPVQLSMTAKQSRTILQLVEEGSFVRKNSYIQMYICFDEEIIEDQTPTPSPLPLPTRTKIKREKLKKDDTVQKKQRGVKNKEKSKEMQPKVESSYVVHKRAISQLSTPQSPRTSPREALNTPSPIQSYEDEGTFSNLHLPEEVDTPQPEPTPYNLRKGVKKRKY